MKTYNSSIIFTGLNIMFSVIVLFWYFEFNVAKLHMVINFKRSCWICHWLFSTIVCRITVVIINFSCLLMHCVFISVTLYAEFLPCKQRAKCVVLLDVSLSISIVAKINYRFVFFFFYMLSILI